MKKILFFIITLFISFNVYADRIYKEYTYRVTIDNELYSVSVKFFENPNKNDNSDSKYRLEDASIILTNGYGERFVWDVDSSNQNKILYISRFCMVSSDVYVCDAKTEFSKEEIEDPDFMVNYLPKFIKYDDYTQDGGYTPFLFYISDETNISEEEKNDFYDKLKEFFSKYNGRDVDMQMQTEQEIIRSYDIINTDDQDLRVLSTDDYVKAGNILKELVEKAKDVKICTEDDLNKIRTKKDYSLTELDRAFDDVPLSSSCYDILFGNGLGDGNLFDNVIRGINYVSRKGAITNYDEFHYQKMGFLYYETYYLEGVGILTGELMQKDNIEVVNCGLFGDKTNTIFQYIFTVMKYIGVILGTLLGVVDVFKIIVSKDVDGKKQFKILSKRIIAIVALILTPILVEIIFDFINTIGINDPICGIR